MAVCVDPLRCELVHVTGTKRCQVCYVDQCKSTVPWRLLPVPESLRGQVCCANTSGHGLLDRGPVDCEPGSVEQSAVGVVAVAVELRGYGRARRFIQSTVEAVKGSGIVLFQVFFCRSVGMIKCHSAEMILNCRC